MSVRFNIQNLKKTEISNIFDCEKILQTEVSKIPVCSVCLDSGSLFENRLIKCKICYLTIHPICYGISIEVNDFICDVCREGSIKPKCKFCEFENGNLRNLENHEWTHILCVEWLKCLSFSSRFKNNVLIDKTINSFINKQCYLCRGSQGYKSKCFIDSCQNHFHVICAVDEGLIYEGCLKKKENIYCSVHFAELNKSFLGKKRKDFIKNKNEDKSIGKPRLSEFYQNKKYRLKVNLARILKINYPLTLEKLIQEFFFYIEGNSDQILQNKDILKDEALKELFYCDYKNKELLKEKLILFLENYEIEKNNIVKNQNMLEHRNTKKDEIQLEPLIEIYSNNSNLYANSKILKRNFLVKEDILKFFKMP